MKRSLVAVLILSLVLITACSKKSGSNLGGTWSFKAANYSATLFATSFGNITVNNQPTAYSNDYTTLTVNFYNGVPTSNIGTYSGTYVVRSGDLDSSNQVSIALNIEGTNSALYRSTGGNGTETINVAITNGKLSLSGYNLELANVSTASDSGSLNFSLLQP